MIKFMLFIIGTLWLSAIASISLGAPEILQQILITGILVVSIISIISSLIYFYVAKDEKRRYTY